MGAHAPQTYFTLLPNPVTMTESFTFPCTTTEPSPMGSRRFLPTRTVLRLPVMMTDPLTSPWTTAEPRLPMMGHQGGSRKRHPLMARAAAEMGAHCKLLGSTAQTRPSMTLVRRNIIVFMQHLVVMGQLSKPRHGNVAAEKRETCEPTLARQRL